MQKSFTLTDDGHHHHQAQDRRVKISDNNIVWNTIVKIDVIGAEGSLRSAFRPSLAV
jgi:hypothetical protein